MINLTEGVTYRAQVLTKLSGAANHAYSPVSKPQTAMNEPLKAWFIDDTPNANFDLGRVFMFVEMNKQNASGVCYINSGAINCPPRTLVSLDIYAGGNYNIRATATQEDQSFGNSQIMYLENTHAAHTGAQVPENLRISAGNKKMLLSWNAAPLDATRVNAYVIETRGSNDGGGTWSDWTTAAVVDKSTCSEAHGNRTHCEHLLTGLDDQMYRVRIRVRTLHQELIEGTTRVNVADAGGIDVNDIIQIDDERMQVTAITDNTLTVTRGHLSSTAAKHTVSTTFTATGAITGQDLDATRPNILVTAGHGIAANDVIKIDDEQMLVTQVAGTILHMTRGHAGTTAAAHSNGSAVSKQTPIPEVYVLDSATTASAALTASATSLAVADASGISANDVIQIDNERMQVTAISGNTLTLTRAHLGTTAAAHGSGAAVYLVTQSTTLEKSYFLGMSSFNPTLTMPTQPTGLPGHVTNTLVEYPGAGKLTVEWDKPTDIGGAEVYATSCSTARPPQRGRRPRSGCIPVTYFDIVAAAELAPTPGA
jgi:azurin